MKLLEEQVEVHHELFAFEVPTSLGHVRIISPARLPQEEADAVADRIARIYRLIANDPDEE